MPDLNDPEARRKRARHAEIAVRYRQRGDRARVQALRISELRRLFSARPITNRDPVQEVKLLLAHGATGPRVMMEYAGRLDETTLNDLIQNTPYRRLKADPLGHLIELTFEEKIALNIRTIRCFDRPKSQVDEFYRNKKRERDRQRQRRLRAEAERKTQQDVTRETSARARAVWCTLYSRCRPISEIITEVASWPDFRSVSGEPLSEKSLRRAVARAAKELEKIGLAFTETRPGPKGLEVDPENRTS